MAELKTSHLILVGALGLIAFNAPSILQAQQQDSALRATRNTTKQTERTIREESRAALTRYLGNCARVVDARSGLETPLTEGLAYTDPASHSLIREGGLMCNKQGDTAVAAGGVATDVKRVSTEDLPKLDSILRANETARTRTGV